VYGPHRLLREDSMKQQYFIVVLAHSLHGRLRRIHVPQRVVYAILALALFGCVSLFGFVSSYVRMAWKVAHYNSLREDLFANQVSVAYGIKQKIEGPADISGEGQLIPTFNESLEQYGFLRSATLTTSSRKNPKLWPANLVPSGWPVEGRLQGHFGRRTDPFSGEGAFHRGVDIIAPRGTPVRAAADGVVLFAAYMSGYGRLVVVDHANGLRTYYAHLSRFGVVAGQDVRRGQTLGTVGSSGRVTAAHLHYEVRQGGNAVDPYRYMARASVARTAKRDFPF